LKVYQRYPIFHW